MSILKTLRLAAVIGTALAVQAGLAGPAAAAGDLRVVEVAGDDTLNVRRSPFSGAAVVGEIPFDARGIEATGERRNGWLRVAYTTPEGERLRGWAKADFLAADQGETWFQVTGVRRGDTLEVRRHPGERGRVIAEIPWNATHILSLGDCQDDYCQIRYQADGSPVQGFVAQANLEVARDLRPESGYEDAYGWDDSKPWRKHRRWWLRRHLGDYDRSGSGSGSY